MFITLAIDDLIFDLSEPFSELVQKLRDQIEELTIIADTLEILDSDRSESEVSE